MHINHESLPRNRDEQKDAQERTESIIKLELKENYKSHI